MSSLSFCYQNRELPEVVEYPFELSDNQLVTPFYPWEDEVRVPQYAATLLQPVLDGLMRMNFKRVMLNALLTRSRVQFFNDMLFSFNNMEYMEYTVLDSHIMYVQYKKGFDVARIVPGSKRLLTSAQLLRHLKHISRFARKYYPV